MGEGVVTYRLRGRKARLEEGHKESCRPATNVTGGIEGGGGARWILESDSEGRGARSGFGRESTLFLRTKYNSIVELDDRD